MSRAARLWERLIGPVLDFAGECFRREYATGGGAVRLPCSGYDETAQAIALGGASLAQEFRGDRSRSSVADFESFQHGQENDL